MPLTHDEDDVQNGCKVCRLEVQGLIWCNGIIYCKNISIPLGRHKFLQNQPILKIKKALKARAQDLSSASKYVSVAQTI